MISKKSENSSKSAVSSHYDDFFEYYRHWSADQSAGYHFGVAEKIGDFFNNDKMLVNASERIFGKLKLDQTRPVKILDAGSGAGQVSILLAEQYPKAEIFGVTISKKQHELGKKLIAKDGLSQRIHLSQNDFEELPFAADFFDAVFFQDSICHGTGISKSIVIKEVARVLKKDGRIALTDGFVFPQKGGSVINAINDQMCKVFGVECWAEDKKFTATLEHNGFVDIEKLDLTWKTGPSVVQTTYIKLPKVFISYLRKKLEWKDVVYTFKVALLAPILGLHPYFKYQLISARKR